MGALMVLLLRNHEIRGLMDLPEYIAAVEAGYRDYGNGVGAAFPRENLWIQGEKRDDHRGGHLPSGSRASFKFKAGLLPGVGAASMNAYTAGLPQGVETFMFLYDTDTGALAAIMEQMYVSWLKTAAVSALATRYLAPPDSTVMALFGAGRHARSQLYGLTQVAHLQRVQVYSRDPHNRAAFCDRMSGELGIEIVPAESPAAALRDADIVTAITTSPSPVFNGADLPDKPLHINGLGAHYPFVRELDSHTIVNSRVFVDVLAQGISENGELVIPLEQGLIEASHVIGDLGDLAAERTPGRLSDSRWTLFLSGGTGIDDAAVARRIYEVALERGVGTDFEFNQAYEFEL